MRERQRESEREREETIELALSLRWLWWWRSWCIHRGGPTCVHSPRYVFIYCSTLAPSPRAKPFGRLCASLPLSPISLIDGWTRLDLQEVLWPTSLSNIPRRVRTCVLRRFWVSGAIWRKRKQSRQSSFDFYFSNTRKRIGKREKYMVACILDL